jgi:hypothetical protein
MVIHAASRRVNLSRAKTLAVWGQIVRIPTDLLLHQALEPSPLSALAHCLMVPVLRRDRRGSDEIAEISPLWWCPTNRR